MNVSWDPDSSAEEASSSVYGPPSGAPLLFEFITNGVLVCAIGVLGLVGNALSMVILSRPQMRSSINCLLLGLASFDALLLATSILIFGLPSIYLYTGCLVYYYWRVFPHAATVVYPVALIAQTGSVYLTLTVTVERWVAVCHPLRARSLCTYGRARLYVAAIALFALLYNLPRFWEVSHMEVFDPNLNLTLTKVIPSALRSDATYIQIYINWSYLLVMYVLPFTCLAVFNGAIYRQVRKANSERQRLSKLQRKEIGLAMMLLCVVVVFFICNLLALVNNVLESVSDIIIDQLVKSSNLLVTVNSSVNFVIYCIFGEKFKRLFLRMFCRRCAGRLRKESPDATRDDSLVSNGDQRNFLLRTHFRSSTARSWHGGPTNGSLLQHQVIAAANTNAGTGARATAATASLSGHGTRLLPPMPPLVYYPPNRADPQDLIPERQFTRL